MPSAPSGSQASDALPRTGQDAEGLRRDIRALENRAQILEGAVGAQAEVEVESTCRRAPRVQCGGCAACFGALLSAFFHEPRPSRGLQQDVNALKDRLGRLESALAMQESERPNSQAGRCPCGQPGSQESHAAAHAEVVTSVDAESRQGACTSKSDGQVLSAPSQEARSTTPVRQHADDAADGVCVTPPKLRSEKLVAAAVEEKENTPPPRRTLGRAHSAPEPPSPTKMDACCICLSAPRECAFTPCGHRCVCRICGITAVRTDRRCPICRATAGRVLRILDP